MKAHPEDISKEPHSKTAKDDQVINWILEGVSHKVRMRYPSGKVIAFKTLASMYLTLSNNHLRDEQVEYFLEEEA